MFVFKTFLYVCLTHHLPKLQGGLEEISLVLHPDRVIVKSYVDNEKTEPTLMKKLLLTEMTLNPNDFEVYDFNTNKKVQLTFCLKEMKVKLFMTNI